MGDLLSPRKCVCAASETRGQFLKKNPQKSSSDLKHGKENGYRGD